MFKAAASDEVYDLAEFVAASHAQYEKLGRARLHSWVVEEWLADAEKARALRALAA
jgi:hypothetical protein